MLSPAAVMQGPPRGSPLGNRLCSAAARGDLAEVRELLEAGADPNGTNSFGRTPLLVGSPGWDGGLWAGVSATAAPTPGAAGGGAAG